MSFYPVDHYYKYIYPIMMRIQQYKVNIYCDNPM